MMSPCKLRSEIELLVEEYYMYDTRKFIQFNLIQFVSLVQTDATLWANNSQHCWPTTPNIVGQQLPTLLDVMCCIRLHTLLRAVVGSCAKFEISGQIFSYVEMDLTASNNVASVCTGL